MSESGPISALFGTARGLSVPGALIILLLDFVVFWLLLLVGTGLFKRFPAGVPHDLGGFLMFAALFEGVWSLISLFIRLGKGKGRSVSSIDPAFNEQTLGRLAQSAGVSQDFLRRSIERHVGDPDHNFVRPTDFSARTLKPGGISEWLFTILCVFIAWFGAEMTFYGLRFGVFVSVVFGIILFASCGYAVVLSICSRPTVSLDPVSIMLSQFGTTRRYLWSDVTIRISIAVGRTVNFPHVSLTVPGSRRSKLLFAHYGMKAIELYALLCAYQKNAVGSTAFRDPAYE